jgi:hypothetical protein
MRNDRSARNKLARLRRRSDKELYLQLSSYMSRVPSSTQHNRFVQNLYDKKAATIVRHERERATYMRVDAEMLETLGAALRGKPSVKLGKTILEVLWERIRERVCDDWDLCRKFRPDTGFILALWAILKRGQPFGESDIYMVVAVLAARMGPEWMCKCSKR